MQTTDFQTKYFAHELTRRFAPDSPERMATAVAGAQVDLNPHQVDAALFAFASPFSKGALLADEVGLGKTIEAGLVISQRWAEGRRRILIIAPSNLRKQWHQELSEKFFLPCAILESKFYNDAVKSRNFSPFEMPRSVVICSYQDSFDNRLIFGDNLLALKALEQDFAGKVKCVYIDPPFNTQQAFDHYDDGLEHSLWLSLIRDRIELVHRLLAPDGTLFIHIDDNELAYLTALVDEVFGRTNRINIATFKQGSATGHKSINPGIVSTSNFVLIYARDKASWMPKRVFTARGERDKRYGQFIANVSEPFLDWRFITLGRAFSEKAGLPEKSIKKTLGENFENEISAFVHQNANAVVQLARPDYKSVSSAARNMIDTSRKRPREIMRLERAGLSDMYFVGGQRILFYSDKLKLVDGEYVAGEPLTSIWDDILSNNLHNEGGVEFPKGKKPEALIKRCLDLATDPGDLVLDSFAGSGTTGAVAHKMGRRWIMVELGEHCHTHIIPRLKKVIDGEDKGGVTEAVGWKGGGGFRYYRIAPSLLEKDRHGREVISKQYNATMLAEALCKLEGFTYAPSDSVYWQQGHSSERDFLYVTTQTFTQEQLAGLSEEVGPERSLLVLCAAFRGNTSAFPNLTVRKIPNHVRDKCEWGHDDYSLNVSNLPQAPEPEPEPPKPQTDLFANGGSKG